MNAATAAATLPLSLRLRAATHDLHRRAERAGIMPALLRGTLARERYVDLLRNLEVIYAALERALARHAAVPALRGFDFSALARAKALAADLAALRDARTAFAPAPAAAAYVARLRDVEREAPALLIAHAYTRYLGDLNGGQRLRAIAARAYGLGDDATSFYAFGGGTTVTARIAAFRAAMDDAPLSPRDAQAVVDEARDAFARHVRLFEELAAA